MKLLPQWEARISQVPEFESGEKTAKIPSIPKAPEYFAAKVNYVQDEDAAADMLQLAQERAIAWIGIDSEFRYTRPLIVVDGKVVSRDPRSVEPLLVSLTLAEPLGSDRTQLYTFVVDVRKGAHLEQLRQLLRLPVPFVGHFLQAELFCLWQLGLPEPNCLWDTWVAEKVSDLGTHNTHYKLSIDADDAEDLRVQAEQEEREVTRYSLLGTCASNGVVYEFARDKERLQQSFLVHASDAPFREEQIRYAGADAVAAAHLYPVQVQRAMNAGALNHLQTIEMPWTTVNSRIIWNGVRIDPVARRRIREVCGERLDQLERSIQLHGIGNSRSHPQLKAFFESEGLLSAFWKAGRFTFDKDQLKKVRDRHPVINLIYESRKVQSLQRDRILLGDSEGIDGRIHPDHRQLGADSGRQSCRAPNLLGLDRTLRPLVVPDPGFGIGEVDLSQIEVGISAAVYGDRELTAMFNTGDVYSAMAQMFFADQLSGEERTLPGDEFKKRKPHLRSRMKTCTLGIIYGVTPHGLALYLETSESEAAGLQAKFMKMFPALRRALDDASAFGAVRGYAATVSGLRRYRGGTGAPSSWERNWLRNHPVQGSACDVFRKAGIRLDRLYPSYGARMILPVHDAYVFEAPLDEFPAVATLTQRVMCEAVQEYFPELRPRAEINISAPWCWNKDGQADALKQWLSQPVQSTVAAALPTILEAKAA